MRHRSPRRRWLAALPVLLLACGQPQPPAGDAVDAQADPEVAPPVDALEDAGSDAQDPLADATAPSDGDSLPDAVSPSADAGPVLCFVDAAPGTDAHAEDVPMPPEGACPQGPPLLIWPTPDSLPPQPADLQVEVGTSDDQGRFVAYEDGQWAPLVHGVQGGIHLWAAVRTDLPGQTLPKHLVEIAGHAYLDCEHVATELTTKTHVHADVHQPGTWTSANALTPGIPVAFQQNDPAPYCGRWVRLVLEVRHPKTGQWGRDEVTLRLWDADNL